MGKGDYQGVSSLSSLQKPIDNFISLNVYINLINNIVLYIIN
jgi:hypothetical protein